MASVGYSGVRHIVDLQEGLIRVRTPSSDPVRPHPPAPSPSTKNGLIDFVLKIKAFDENLEQAPKRDTPHY